MHTACPYMVAANTTLLAKNIGRGKVREASFLAPELVSRDLVAPMSSGGAEGAKNQ